MDNIDSKFPFSKSKYHFTLDLKESQFSNASSISFLTSLPPITPFIVLRTSISGEKERSSKLSQPFKPLLVSFRVELFSNHRILIANAIPFNCICLSLFLMHSLSGEMIEGNNSALPW